MANSLESSKGFDLDGQMNNGYAIPRSFIRKAGIGRTGDAHLMPAVNQTPGLFEDPNFLAAPAAGGFSVEDFHPASANCIR